MAKDIVSTLIGDKELARAILDLGDNAAKQIMKPAIGKALTPARQRARENISGHKLSGALHKSISKKAGGRARSSKAWGKIYVKSTPMIWNGKKINPVKYAHILEFGSQKNNITPTHFMNRAMIFGRGQMLNIMDTQGRIQLAKYTAKLRRKHNTLSAAKRSL